MDLRWAGSQGPSPVPIWIIPGVIESTTCLLPMVTDFDSQAIALYGHYKAGHLMAAGGMLEQPNAYIEAMELLEGTFNQLQAEQLKRGRN